MVSAGDVETHTVWPVLQHKYDGQVYDIQIFCQQFLVDEPGIHPWDDFVNGMPAFYENDRMPLAAVAVQTSSPLTVTIPVRGYHIMFRPVLFEGNVCLQMISNLNNSSASITDPYLPTVWYDGRYWLVFERFNVSPYTDISVFIGNTTAQNVRHNAYTGTNFMMFDYDTALAYIAIWVYVNLTTDTYTRAQIQGLPFFDTPNGRQILRDVFDFIYTYEDRLQEYISDTIPIGN